MSVGIVTYYLEMTEPGQLVRPGRDGVHRTHLIKEPAEELHRPEGDA